MQGMQGVHFIILTYQKCHSYNAIREAGVALTPEGYRTIPAEVRHIDHSEDTAGLMLLHGPADQVDLAQWFTSLEAPAGSEFRRAV